jgi:multiple sugar transport system permease protein
MSDAAPATRSKLRRPLEPSPVAYIFYPVLAAAVLLPLSWTLFGGFKRSNEIFAYPPTILPRSATLQNFIELFTRLEFGGYIWNSVVVASARCC